jgi:hypothetical protein
MNTAAGIAALIVLGVVFMLLLVVLIAAWASHRSGRRE